jgi:uncharacterized membrane-anchored protein
VTRYAGANRGRIFNGEQYNWLSGHHSGKVGVAYHEGWLQPDNDLGSPATDFIISVDRTGYYRGISQTFDRNCTGASSADNRLGISASLFLIFWLAYIATKPTGVVIFSRHLCKPAIGLGGG